MEYTINCNEENKGDDRFIPFTDVYVVPGVSVGGNLVDATGSFNTIRGSSDGAFALETLGFARNLAPGIYSVVYDECQDGKVGPETITNVRYCYEKRVVI